MARRVLFAPFYTSNPYQTRLATALGDVGVTVSGARIQEPEPPSLEAALVAEHPELLHLHWLHPYFLADGAVKSAWRGRRMLARLAELQRAGVGVVWTAHNLANHEARFPRVDRYVTRGVARLAHGVVAHCECARERLIEEFGAEIADRVHVVPHANYIADYPNDVTRDAARAELGLDPDAPVFLFLGRVRGYKGVFELLEAFQRAPLPDNAHLLIAGKATDERVRVRLKRRCKKAERVTLEYGFVPGERLQVFFNAADACVFPYRDILTSGAAVLAMSFAMPILAPPLGCLGEVLDEEGAWFIDQEDDRGLDRALVRAVADRDRYAAMGRHNFARAESWSPALVADAHRTIYDSVMRAAAR